MPGISAQKLSFSPKYAWGDERYWADLAQWYWFWSTVVTGPSDPHAEHPDRDIIVFSRGKRPVKRFLGIPYTQFKFVADIDLPSAQEGNSYDAYRHYWRQAAGMDGGTVALLDGFYGVMQPMGGWAAAVPVPPAPHPQELLARRVFGVETFQLASAALYSSMQARQIENLTVESKFA